MNGDGKLDVAAERYGDAREQVASTLPDRDSGADDGGVTVWIPLQRVQHRLLAAGHLQGPTRTVTQLRTTPFLW